MPLALVTAAVMLAGWFPLATLLGQQSQLSDASAQINAIVQEQQALQSQRQSINSKSAAIQLAREQYQLVAPGQSLIQVLPGRSNGFVSQSTGDPGFQPLVAPSSVSSLVAVPSSAPTRHSSVRDFVSRLLRTLEFWR